MATWLERINVLELSAVRRPANRKQKLLQKAEWSTTYINDLPDSAFLYIAPGGEKDSEGRTAPRSLRHFPVRGASGEVDPPHLRNALARIPQSNVPAAAKQRATETARRLLETFNKSTEDCMLTDEALTEYFTKAKMSPEQKEALKGALGVLRKAKKEMDENAFKSTATALMKLLGLEAATKTAEELEQETAAAVDAAKAEAVRVCKGVLDKLQAETPAINDAVTELAGLAGVTPTLKRLEQLPPELQAEWQAMAKSREDDRARVEALEKAIAQREEQAAAREYHAKAEALTHVPSDTTALGQLLHAVAKSEDKAAAETLDAVLKSYQELARQSALFHEVGGSGQLPQDKTGVMGKLEAMAEKLVEKSERPLTREQAVAAVLKANPKMYEEYCRQA